MLRALAPLLFLVACNPDGDGDGFGPDLDCDDADASVFPGADEVCDGVDQDCDGEADEDAIDATTWHADADRDGFGDPNASTVSCEQPPGTTEGATDCDDGDPDTNPVADEQPYDGIDQDCDGADLVDVDGDGHDYPADCDDADPKRYPGATETCDRKDEDCSGRADDGAALGATSDCAALDCADVRDAGTGGNGLYWIDPVGAGEVQAYCIQDVEGGGWAVLWKNTGGANGATTSNADLLSGDMESPVTTPHTVENVSGVADDVGLLYAFRSGVQLLKLATLYAPDGSVAAEQSIVVDLGDNNFADLFPFGRVGAGENCIRLGDKVKVSANEGTLLGETDYLYARLFGGEYSFGLANSGHPGDGDACGQPESNLITDGAPLYRLDDAGGLNGIRHLFSYVHGATGADATRCQFACWTGDNNGGYYDAFTWAVRVR